MKNLPGKSKGDKTGMIIGIGIALAGVAGMVYAIMFASKKPSLIAAPGGTTTNTTQGSSTTAPRGTTTYSGGGSSSDSGSSSSSQFPLKMGSNDNGSYGYVTRLQNDLQGLGQSITADGVFGSATQAALQAVTGQSSVANMAALQNIENMSVSASNTSNGYGSSGPALTSDQILGLNQPIDTSDSSSPAPAPTSNWLTTLESWL